MKTGTLIIAYTSILLLFSGWKANTWGATSLDKDNQEIKLSSKIEHVTVYQNSAKVSRSAETSLSKGTHVIVLSGLSPHINAQSMQVGIDKGATLLSAQFRQDHLRPEEMTDEQSYINDSLKWVNKQLLDLQAQRNIYEQEKNLIIGAAPKIGERESGYGVKMQSLREMADFHRSRLLELLKLTNAIDTQKETLTGIQTRLNAQMKEWNRRYQAYPPSGELVLTVSAEVGGSCRISCAYQVMSASWTPIYDLRSDGIDKGVNLIYKAQVKQNTGVDWSDVGLTVSTGNPTRSNARPILNPSYIDFVLSVSTPTSTGIAPPPVSNMYNLEAIVTDKKAKREERDDYGDGYSNTLDFKVQQNQLNVQFDIDIPYSIPSDNKDHLVKMKLFELPTEYKYHSVPKLDQGAFLLAKVTEWGQMGLLRGNANLFFEGTFIGQSPIDPFSTRDTLLLSMGRDESISIKRTLVTDQSSKKIIGANMKETKTIEISIRNNKNEQIDIDVLDQIPVSKNKDILVKLIEEDGAEHTEEYGKLLWRLNLLPNSSKKIRFTYTIKRPKNKSVRVY